MTKSGYLSAAQIDAFRTDGVVHLRNAFSPSWINRLAQGLDEAMQHPSPRHSVRRVKDDFSSYQEDYWVWSSIPQFEAFLRESPAAGYAARLLNASRINLVMDNWFVREAGSHARAPWHHDVSYFDFEGRMCAFWIPLEACRAGQGIEFVRGSHLWEKRFMRVYFDGHQLASEPGWINGRFYQPPPDIDQNRDQYDLISFGVEPGDCLCFDIRLLHGTSPDHLPETRQRRFTVRMAAEDGCIRYRGDWTKPERREFELAGHQDGDPLDSEFFPRLWPIP
ncbi:MAG: deoxygenase [Gammaproteobacteria bacterium]|jgi:ectoine hydroxylase-related dioxygenase (phytanoyl-CoA dioxygenase family)|nr:deoxygenase [Gammaproteobacteria bacterium]MBT5205243.1 deoxygenase [Gammaproteobacteria bacterium]MBT5601154.1 deoxygenase [Gammaproteobacteria bacterium]MBT6246384.1 deoxygenase [Gammaproteobacteria bacterium]